MPFATSDGARIHYHVSGPSSGEAVILIMGLGWDMTGWEGMLPHLRDYRVIRLDNRGAGRSDAPDEPYSISGMAADVVAVMEGAQVESAHVYGASLGGMIAQELALRHPARVRSLVLGCTSPGILSIPGHPAVLWLMLNRERLPRDEALRRAPPYLFHRSHENDPAVQEVMRQRLLMPMNPVGYRRQRAAVARWTSLRRLRSLRVPTLVLHGDRDRLIPEFNGRLLAALIPGARYHRLRNAGHVYSVDAPDEAAAAVVDFLSEQRGPSRVPMRRRARAH